MTELNELILIMHFYRAILDYFTTHIGRSDTGSG